MSATATPLRVLHRRLAASMGLASLAAFISGAGLDTPSPIFAAGALIIALFWAPSERIQRVLDPAWRIVALLLTARALYRVFTSPDDVVLPMVDLLLVLLVSENLKESGAAGDTRVYSLSFALLVAACAYRPGVVFAASFITYTALATVTLMVGHFIKKLSQHQARDVRLERGFLLRIASLSGVMLALSAIVFAAFPRVSRGWMNRQVVPAASVVGFSDRVSLAEHGSRIYPNPEVVLRVEFPEGRPQDVRALYWRGRSYDLFDGTTWHRSVATPKAAPSSYFYAQQWRGRRTVQRIYAIPLEVPVLFGIHPVLSVQPQSRMRAMQDNVGDLWYYGAGSPTYDVVSATDRPPDEDLRRSPNAIDAADGPYLQRPLLSERVRALADSLTANAPTRFDKVLAVQNWLQREFRYTLELPATEREATLEYFLFRRRAGHCEYFSTAMAILLREVGIPTRNVNGFLGGHWNEFGQFLTVTQNQAHSWVEVYFIGYGWVPFDGTPAATTDIAEEQQSWLMPLRTFMDGFEHRWNKWVLEYNLEKQVNLFQRATETFARRDSSGGFRINPGITRGLKYIVVALIGVFVLAAIFRRGRTQELGAESRVYLRVRRIYEKAGYDVRAADPPLQFVKRLERSNAPAHEAARRTVDLYLRSRFGGEDIGEEGRQEIRRSLLLIRERIRGARELR